MSQKGRKGVRLTYVARVLSLGVDAARGAGEKK